MLLSSMPARVVPAGDAVMTLADFTSPAQEEQKRSALKAKTMGGTSAAAAVSCPQCERTFSNMGDLHEHFDFVHVTHVDGGALFRLPDVREQLRALAEKWPRSPPLTPRTRWRSTPLERGSRLLRDRTVFVTCTLARCLWGAARLTGRGCGVCCGAGCARWKRWRVERKYGGGGEKRRARWRGLRSAPARSARAFFAFFGELRAELREELARDVAKVGHGLEEAEASVYAIEHLGHTEKEKRQLAQQVLAAKEEERGREKEAREGGGAPKSKAAWAGT